MNAPFEVGYIVESRREIIFWGKNAGQDMKDAGGLKLRATPKGVFSKFYKDGFWGMFPQVVGLSCRLAMDSWEA
jgi:hypothetical protein